VLSFPFPYCNDDPPSDFDTLALDDFNIDGNAEDVGNWIGDQHIVELSQNNPAKLSEKMALKVNLLL